MKRTMEPEPIGIRPPIPHDDYAVQGVGDCFGAHQAGELGNVSPTAEIQPGDFALGCD
jgi:hypothetical protein